MAAIKPNKTLIEAVIATLAGSFTYTIPLQHSALVANGLVEVNPAITDPNGKGLATRATQAGIDLYNAWNAEQTGTSSPNEVIDVINIVGNPAFGTPAPATGRIPFEIKGGFVPVSKKRGNTAGNSRYPFDKLEVGQSFFVPNTEKHPDIAKSLASTVSSAIARYEEVIEGQTRLNRKGVHVPATIKTRIFAINRVEGGADIGRTK